MRQKKWLIVVGVVLAVVVGAERYGRPVMAQVRAALVQNVDEPGRNPFAFYTTTLGGAPNPTAANFSVPSGKRYVVQQFTAQCEGNAAGAVVVTLNGSTNGTRVLLVAPTSASPFINDFVYSGTGTTPLYADPGSNLEMSVFGFGPGQVATCSYSVSGYVINNP